MAGMGLRATHNLPEVLSAIDAWAGAVIQIAAPRAVNKVIGQAETAGFRKINSIYRIGPRTMDKYAEIVPAKGGSGEITALIRVKGQGFPIYVFNPRQTKKGVEFTLKGRRWLIPHAFIARMSSGHVGVFARGAYGGKGKIIATGEKFGRFAFGKRRFSINELFTLSPPGAFSNPDVTQAMNDRVAEQLPKVLDQEIRFATR